MRLVPSSPPSRLLAAIGTVGTAVSSLLIGLSCLAPPAHAAAPARPTAARATASYSYLPMNLRAVVVASRQVGRPYVYGAAGPWAFDCSGLVQYAYARAGRRLPHNALSQYRSIRHVPLSQLRPGDLVFMNFSGGSPAGITHVGIYAGGGNWYVAKKPGTRVMVQHIWTHRGVYAGRP
ncbi:MAG TPA: C40 family peptidase [Jatrophihabitans sp.]|nr:C40 family peptidase [Jatrophihabitans sp.]